MNCNKYSWTSHIRSACYQQTWTKVGNWGKGLENNCFRVWSNRIIMAMGTENFPGDRTKTGQIGGTKLPSSGTQFLCDHFNFPSVKQKLQLFTFCHNTYAEMSLLKTVRGSKAMATKITNSWGRSTELQQGFLKLFCSYQVNNSSSERLKNII